MVENPDEIIELLNKALSDEWLAYYQYWIGAKIVRGPMRPNVESELSEHANEELKHAEMLTERIIILGGTPILNPNQWTSKANCQYDEPSNPEVKKILQQNIKGERCAINVYKKILEKISFSNDPITANMVRKIMEDEVGHEEDLQNLLEDIEMIK